MSKILKSIRFLIGLFIIYLISGVIAVGILSIFNKDLTESNQYKYLVIFIINLITLILLSLIYSAFRNSLLTKTCFRHVSFKNITYVALLGIGITIVVSYLISVLLSLIPNYLNSYYADIQVITEITNNSPIQVVFITILIPIYEEIFFRGVIFEHFKKNYNIISATILQALVFGLVHGIGIQLISSFIFGIALGLIYIRYNSLVANSVLHMIINSMVLIINTGLISSSYIVHFISVIVAIICLIFSIYKITRKDNNNYENA